MLQSFKKISAVLWLVAGLSPAWAFAPGGPIANGGDAWQVSVIGYGLAADIVAPKNIGEEYRLNCQKLYYACDANFLNFYGSNGAVAIDQAYTIINNSLTNNGLGGVDGYSTGLTEFPLNSLAVNYQASGLSLTDVKSLALSEMMEEMGLAQPERWVWTLHDRFLPGGAQCPGYEYLVIQRNLDITASPLNQIQYSPYVNGTLWTYIIREACPASVPDPQALAVPRKTDPLALSFTAVAELGNNVFSAGTYFTGLTRDDMGGLRWLLTTNNIKYESPATGGLLLSSTASGGTNYGGIFPLFTYDLNAFVYASLTNSPLTLSNLYPGLVITSSSNHYFIQYTTNVYAYFTPLIGGPAGSLKLAFGQTVTWAVAINYYNTYANIVTNSYQPTSIYALVTVQAQQVVGAPAGTLTTTTNYQFVTVPNVPSGDFYINTNACGPNLIIGSLFTNTVATTNLTSVVTNASGTVSNVAGLFFSQTQISYATTHILLAEPIICGASGGGTATNSPGLYQGIGKVQFIKASFDSLLGTFFQPITNTYTMVRINNGQAINQTYQRVVTAPDYLFSAADLAPGPANLIAGYGWRRNINFNQSTIGAGLAGPGTIDPAATGVTITLDKVGDIYRNVADGDELTEQVLVAWGSFDGSTNAPVVYPNGTDLANLANQVLVQVAPATLPNGTKGVPYLAPGFQITGGAFTAPYTWNIPTGALPPGLTLSSTGVISGTPTLAGTFDFTLQLTDVNARSVQWNYSLTIQ